MAGLFDDLDFDVEGEEETPPQGSSRPDPAGQIARELSEETIDDELAEAEKRLAKAAYYRVIVRDGVIQDDGTSGPREINAEARLWARRQMAALLGVASPDQPEPPTPAAPAMRFTAQEVEILKKVVERTLAIGARPAEPVVRKVEASQTQMPAVQRVETKPVPQPQPAARMAKPKPAKPTKPGKPQDPNKQRILRPRVGPDGEVRYDAIPTGETFRDPLDKNLYRFVPHPDKEGERLKMNVTHQVSSPQAIPMPSREQMAMITHSQASAAVNTGASSNSEFPDAASGHPVGRAMFVAAAAHALKQE